MQMLQGLESLPGWEQLEMYWMCELGKKLAGPWLFVAACLAGKYN